MTHHAYMVEGSLSLLPQLVKDARQRFGATGEHDPDVHVRQLPKFGIEESRWLTHAAALKSASGRALFVLGVGSITSEAQQALLKLLEEPQAGTVFVLLVPHGALLPTVRSRMTEYKLKPALAPHSDRGRSPSQASVFLKASGKARSDMVAALLKDEEGVRERARDLVDALEAELYEKIADQKARAGLEDVAMVRRYLGDRSPSFKMLLEHLAVSLPASSETSRLDSESSTRRASRGGPTL